MAANHPSAAGQTGHATHLAPSYPFGTTLGMRPSRTASPLQGSVTQTITPTRGSRSATPEPLVLRLRGSHEPTPEAEEAHAEPSTGNNRRRRIQWAEDVVDNEGLGRKKSKVCCIFHKDREVGESSSDESSSSDSDSDSSGADDGSARLVGGSKSGKKRKRGRKHHHHDHDEHGDDCERGHGGGRRPSPNAYERMPRYDVKPLNGNPPGQEGGQGGLKS